MKNVVVVTDNASGQLMVAGHASYVDRLERSLLKAVNKKTEKSCTTKEVKVSQAVCYMCPQAVCYIMCPDVLKEKLLSIYPHFKMTCQQDNPNLIVTGFAHEILELKEVLCDQGAKCKRLTFEAICLSGHYNNVSECKTFVEDQVASVAFESFQVSIPGAKKIYKNQEASYASLILKDTGCVVRLVDDPTADQGGIPDKEVPKPVYQNQTRGGLEIVVCKADLCQYPVHAVICGSTKDLKNTSGLARALVSAAGPQLQLECDQLITSGGELNCGSCVIMSGGGQLCCKKVIFTVVPRLDPANVKTLARLKKAIIQSLQLVESHGCTSVAMSIMSKSQGVPVELCAATQAKALMEHCKMMLDTSVLKEIHFVDNDDVAIKVIASAIRKVFENDSTHTSQQLPSVGGSESATGNQAIAHQKCLCQEQTRRV